MEFGYYPNYSLYNDAAAFNCHRFRNHSLLMIAQRASVTEVLVVLMPNFHVFAVLCEISTTCSSES